MNVLMVDIGGSSVKTMVSDQEEMRKFPSSPTLTPKQMVAGVKAATRDWTFDAITVGFPGLVENGQLVREPLNLGGGWLTFDLAHAFGERDVIPMSAKEKAETVQAEPAAGLPLQRPCLGSQEPGECRRIAAGQCRIGFAIIDHLGHEER